MSESVGVIYYEVEADTSKLLNSISPADQSLDRLQKTFDRTDKAASQANFQMTKAAAAVKSLGRESQTAASSLGGLTKLLGGYLTLQGANTLIEMAEGYREMGERIRFATASQEEYEMVQQRLLATANGTYRALSEAQEVYILTADSLRSMGYSTDQAVDITDSLSYAFVKNSASTQRAQSAISAYTKSIQTGKVQVDSWQSLLAAVPSVIQDIAKASGKSAEEVRRMGAEGKLTAQMLNEGLRQSLDSNKAASDGMATTVRDAFNNMRNSLSVYLGESKSATSSTALLSKAILLLGNNIEAVVNVLMTVGAGALAKYIAQNGAAVIASGRATLAARAQAAEGLRLAQAHAAATATALVQAQTNANLSAMSATAARAADTHAAALARVAAAKRAAAAAGASLAGALGGPVGIIALLATAATGMYMFSGGVDDARRSVLDLNQPLDEAVKKFKELTESQRKFALQASNMDLDDGIKRLDGAMRELALGVKTDGLEAMARWQGATSNTIRELVAAAKDGKISYQELDASIVQLIQSFAEADGRSEAWVNHQIELATKVAAGAQQMDNARQRAQELKKANDDLASSALGAAAGQRELNAALAGFDGESGDALKKLQDRVAALQDGNSEVKKAERYLSSLTNVSDEFKVAYMSAAQAADHLAEANKRHTASAKAGNKVAEERKRAEEENAKVIDKLAESLYQAGLSGEALAVAKARASLNEFASAEEVAQIEALARALHTVQEAQAELERFGTGKDADKYIMGQVSPLSGGMFDDQYARYEAEAKVEEERYAGQLERLQKAREIQANTHLSYNELEEQAAREHAQRMQQIEQAKSQVLLSSGRDLFSSLADAAKNYAGESSGAYKALFAASKAFAIAQATLNLSSAISQAMADPTATTPAQKFANMATIASAGGQLVSAISSASYGGGRQYGGPVSPGKMYRINETGAPEILNTNGKQYLMMSQASGRVEPMDRASSGGRTTSSANGGPGGVNVVINIQSDGTTETQTPPGMEQFGKHVGEIVRAEFQKLQVRSFRPGGLGWQQTGGGVR